MQKTISRETIIKSTIRELHDFGYPDANEDNIFTDKTLSGYFQSELVKVLHDLNPEKAKGTIEVINGLLYEIIEKKNGI